MKELIDALPWILTGLMVLVVLAVLRKPLCRLGGVVLRTVVSLVALLAFSQVGGWVGVTLGINLVNALVIGVLGLPGFGLLLMLNWALAI